MFLILVTIKDGLFTQSLDFGSDAFTGAGRWLGIEVMCPGETGFAVLGLWALTATPYALYASAAGDADLLGGLPAGAFWAIDGNADTDPTTDLMGTRDAITLTLAVSGMTALRLGPAVGTPNIIGGYGGNSVAPGVEGATIGGGGQSNNLNQVTANYAVIAGGDRNIVYGQWVGIALPPVGGFRPSTMAISSGPIRPTLTLLPLRRISLWCGRPAGLALPPARPDSRSTIML